MKRGGRLNRTIFARGVLPALLVAAACGCGDSSGPDPKTGADALQNVPGGKAAGTGATPGSGAAGSVDPLGQKPTVGAPKPFEPKAPVVLTAPNGMAVWLFERPTLPLVSVTLALPRGAAVDPPDKPGLAHITADMLDEGAGTRSAVELSSAINDLGASLSVGTTVDGSYASLTVLKKNFAPAFGLLGDIVTRPRLDPKEWKRVSELWKNDLRQRADDPAAVSRVVTAAAHYGPDSPYGHPAEGLLRGAAKVGLADVKAFYKANWRPDQATLVIAGDVTKSEAMQLVGSIFGEWKAPAEAAPPPPAPAGPATGWTPPRLVLVDRAKAPQSVIAVVRDGIPASDPKAPMLDLINTALGGSFTSRLNQNLREDHGWSYGARSAFTESRGRGTFVARASVHTEVTGPALKELLGELTKMSSSGPTPDELIKVLAQDRSELVQAYEGVGSVSSRLGRLAMLGLSPTFDAEASRTRQGATLQKLTQLAPAVDPKGATIVVVGPRALVAPQLAAIGLGEPELWDAEGTKRAGAPAAPAAPAAKGAPAASGVTSAPKK